MYLETEVIPAKQLFSSLPKEQSTNSFLRIQEQLKELQKILIVLDDDPTGTQTVHDVPVLTDWSVESIYQEFTNGSKVFYILSNSRSLSAHKANSLAIEIGGNILEAAKRSNKDFLVISRGDSTLRGHYPNEVDALGKTLKTIDALKILIPAFFEGGRYTINDIHYVQEGANLIPAAMTPFAQDKAFGFRHSDLKYYIEEKSNGNIKASDVVSFSIEELRTSSPEAIAKKLIEIPQNATCIVNATSYADLENFVLGFYLSGRQALLRTAASAVRAFAGIGEKALLRGDEFRSDSKSGVLIIVGSYVPKTSSQLNELKNVPGLVQKEMDVSDILGNTEHLLDELVAEVDQRINNGQHVVLFTSRNLITDDNPEVSLQIGGKVSDFIVNVVQSLNCQPKCILAKGGITSSDVATKGLSVKRALVVGQILPGIPVWNLGQESKYPDMNYIVFPGNVGADDALKKAVLTITGA